MAAFMITDLLSCCRSKNDSCIIDGSTLSYNDVNHLSSCIASMLKERGVTPGDRVVIFLPNSWQYIVSFFGVLKAGAIASLVDFRSSQRELGFFLEDSDPSFVLTDASRLEWTSHQDLPVYSIDTQSSDLLNIENKINPLQEPVARSPSDVACLIYTGGTTGKPKGAMLTHRNFEAVLSGLSRIWALRSGEEVFAQLLPMTHSGGLNCGLNSALFSGGRIVIIRKFDPPNFCKAVEKYRISAFAGVPTIFWSLVSLPSLEDYDLSSLKICFCSGAPISTEIAERFRKRTGITINVGWGLTEASPQLTVAPLGIFKPSYVGMPIESTTILSIDEEGIQNDLMVEGELAARGPQLMKGYWRNEEETVRVFTSHGYLRTGDIGYVGEDGVYILGRKKDQINSGGYKIWPHEVESILMENDCVKEAAVVGVSHPAFGETVKAFVVLRNPITESDLKAFCKERLAGYKLPRYIEFVDSLPKSSVGKILHRVLREKG